MDRRAVSEVIAFILVFSIVITSVGLLYTVGFDSLRGVQEAEQDRSAQRAFGALAVAFQDVQTDRASTRRARIELNGRTLSVNESEALAVSVGGETVNASGALVYGAFEDTEIVYQSGAVLRRDGRNQQITSRPPRFRCGDDYGVVSLVEIQDPDNESFSSAGGVGIQMSRQSTSGRRLIARNGSVDVSYEGSRYGAAWEDYFEAEGNGWEEVTGESDTYRCSPDFGEVYVRRTTVQIDFSSV